MNPYVRFKKILFLTRDEHIKIEKLKNKYIAYETKVLGLHSNQFGHPININSKGTVKKYDYESFEKMEQLEKEILNRRKFLLEINKILNIKIKDPTIRAHIISIYQIKGGSFDTELKKYPCYTARKWRDVKTKINKAVREVALDRRTWYILEQSVSKYLDNELNYTALLK